MKISKFILSAVLLAACSFVQAHDFVATIGGQKVYFNIKSKKNRTAEITYNGSIASGLPACYEGELILPDKIKHNNTVYSIVGVGPKAFSGADKLTGVVLPSGISSIGDFAFEGCSSLNKIIFPGNVVKFGQGVFFKCDKIQDISLGSDWKEVDLKMFRWSDSLKTVTIPAKVEKIQNLKSLKALESVVADINNARFATVDGILYNKNKETLYGCPRAYKGKACVADGTKTIYSGAFADCKNIVLVDLPESLTAMSFKEFARMPELRTILFRSLVPIKTARQNEADVFLLQVSDSDLKIVVPKIAKEDYKVALVQQSGEYTEIGGTTPFLIEQNKMPATENIIGVKNFTKYE